MNNGLKILIERMREHPEDFVLDSYRLSIRDTTQAGWSELISVANGLAENDCLSDEEVGAWIEAKKRLMVDNFNAKVLDAVNYVPPQPVQYQEVMRLDSSANIGIGANLASNFFGANTIAPQIAVGSTKLSESDIKHIKKKVGLK